MTFLKILPLLGLVTFRAVSAPPESAGFTSLFDGKTWAGWDHPAHLDGVWEIADGVIRLRTDEPKRVSGKDYTLSTTRRYKDFSLMLDWRLTGKPSALQMIANMRLPSCLPVQTGCYTVMG